MASMNKGNTHRILSLKWFLFRRPHLKRRFTTMDPMGTMASMNKGNTNRIFGLQWFFYLEGCI